MSVDLTQLTAHLSPQQQETVRKAYRHQAENETAAFLLCFFLGLFGAHRFYLRQWGQGFLHLLVTLAIAAVIVGGVLTGTSPAVIALIAIPLLLLGLVWMFIDLFRIDAEVAARNLRLAEKLTAGSVLDDRSVESQVQSRLDELTRRVSAGPAPDQAADQVPAASAAAGTLAAIDYAAATVTAISAEPQVGQQAETATPQSWTTTEQVSEPAAAARDTTPASPPLEDTIVRSHSETAYSVTDSVETYHTIPAETQAAAAAGAEAPADDESLFHSVMGEPEPPVDDSAYRSVMGEPEPLYGSTAGGGAPAAFEAPPTPAQAEAATWPDHPQIQAGDVAAAAGLGALAGSALAGGTASGASLDVTDQAPADSPPAPVADVATAGAAPHQVRLDAYEHDASQDTPPVLPIAVRPAYDEPEPPPDALLTLVPDSGAGIVPPEPSPDAYLPPTVPVYDTAATTPAYEPPTYVPPETEHPSGETLAELAGYAAGGAVLGAAASEVARPAEEPPVWPVPDAEAPQPAPMDMTQDLPGPPPTPAPDVVNDTHVEGPRHMLKRIRVVRQIKVGDQIVEESAAEEYIDPDADPEPVKERLREKLRREAEARQQGGASPA